MRAALLSRRRSGVALAVALAACVATARPPLARATVFHAKDEALKLAFPGADRVVDRPVILTDEQKAAVEQRAHAPLESLLWTVYSGWRGDELLGYAVIDTHTVRTLPETIMVVLSAAGEVRRVEILAFYEPPEYSPPERWARQFPGRRLDDELKLGAGIQGITGATLSATAMTASVRRVLALYGVLADAGLLRGK
jgi:hypothetical protein